MKRPLFAATLAVLFVFTVPVTTARMGCVIQHYDGSESEWTWCSSGMSKNDIQEDMDGHAGQDHGGYGMKAMKIDGPCPVGGGAYYEYAWYYDGGDAGRSR